MSETYKVNGSLSLWEALAAIKNLDMGKRWEITVVEDDDRTLRQNKLQHKHYAEIATHHGFTPEYAKWYCKYKYGLPILIHDDPAMMEYFSKVLTSLKYSDRIEAMEHIDLTSLFNKKQAARYTDIIYQAEGELGVVLTVPESER